MNDQSAPLASLEELTGFNALVGYSLTEWQDGYAKLVLPLRPEHLNRSGILHGGVMTTMIDVSCGFTGAFTGDPETRKTAVTLSLSVQFIGKANPDGLLTATARRRGGGSRIFFADADLTDADGALIATGSGTFRLRTQGGPQAEPSGPRPAGDGT